MVSTWLASQPKMLRIAFHSVLVFVTIYQCTYNLSRFVIFLSKQDVLGCTEDRHHLSHKHLYQSTEGDVKYVAGRIAKDGLLLLLFMLQHSVMASDQWKRILLKLRIKFSERLFYVLATSFALMFLRIHWASTPSVFLWEIDSHQRYGLWLFFLLLHCFCWLIIFLQCCLMDPLEMLGVQQVYHAYKHLTLPINTKSKPLQQLYSHYRHAGVFCLWIILWVHPVMTLDRMLLAIVLNLYLKLFQPVTFADHRFACTYFAKIDPYTTTTTVRRKTYHAK